ncbi:MAG: Gfo/Idh/MocA family oxidoreductase [Opitutaceae bacterium]|nr:Gfo/Idh/MocA family oxidoreductase [Opitutaceae bacterium]
MRKLRAGVIGCGAISPAYFKGCAIYGALEIVACADLDVSRAQARAAEFGVPRALAVDALLADPEIDLVINLTVPQAHAPVCRAALEAGKHAYAEKPLALTRADAADLLALAQARGLRLGCAPDTFLGAGLQTSRLAVDEGMIGEPVAAVAFCCGHGHESWHPSPQFYYQRGGGPLFDMGPYYLTALVNLLGPARRVSASTRTTFATRTITSQPLAGTVIPVETPTHLAGTIDFECGVVATMVMSFDLWHHNLPRIEIYGSEGSLVVPDPNHFDGAVLVRRHDEREWRTVAPRHAAGIGRGTGVADMAAAIVTGRPHRASDALAAHVVDIMQAFDESSSSGRHIAITSRAERPAALPPGLPPGRLD